MKYGYSILPFLRALKALFIPDIGEAVAAILIAVLIYGGVSYNYWLDVVSHSDQQLKEYYYEFISDTFNKLGQVPHAANVVTAILWGIAGIALYIALVVTMYFVITTKNNSELNQSLKGKPALLAFSLVDEYRRVIWIVVAATFLGLTIFSLLPIWMSSFAAFNFSRDISALFIGIVGLSYNLYVLFSSFVLAMKNPRILY